MTADITLRGPGDVVALLPYQLGYHPRDSVVVVSLRGRRVGLVARADLPPAKFVDEVVSSLMGPLVRDRATAVIVLGYEDVPHASQPVLLALVEQLERAGIDVVDVPVVRDGRRYSAICSDSCCPPEGIALPDPADVPGVAEYVALGRSPLRSRSDVDALVAPEPWRCLGVARAVASRSRLPRGRRRSALAWSMLLRPGDSRRRPLDRRTVADVALGLADIPWRDGLIAWLVPSVLSAGSIDPKVMASLRSSLPTWGGMGLALEQQPPGLRVAPDGTATGVWNATATGAPASSPGGGSSRVSGGPGPGAGSRSAGDVRMSRAEREALVGERDELLQRLLALCRSVPDECPAEAAAVCTVAAHVAWVDGDGAIARAAVERALRLAPDYRLAQLLEQLIETGLRLPSVARSAPSTDGLGRVS